MDRKIVDKLSEIISGKFLEVFGQLKRGLELEPVFDTVGLAGSGSIDGNHPGDLVKGLLSKMVAKAGESACQPSPAAYYQRCAETVTYDMCNCDASGPRMEWVIEDCSGTPHTACTTPANQPDDWPCRIFKCIGDFICSVEAFDGCVIVYYQDDGCPHQLPAFNGCDNAGNNFQCSEYGHCSQQAPFICSFSCEAQGTFGCWGSYSQRCGLGDYNEDACEKSGTMFYCKTSHECQGGSGADFVCEAAGEFTCGGDGASEFICTGEFCSADVGDRCSANYCVISPFDCSGLPYTTP